jgi:hypothetical protein
MYALPQIATGQSFKGLATAPGGMGVHQPHGRRRGPAFTFRVSRVTARLNPAMASAAGAPRDIRAS